MRQIQHFFIDANLHVDTLSVRDKELLHQLKDVLRFRTGDACVLLDNHGGRAEAVLELLHAKEAIFRIEKYEKKEASSRDLRLYFALPKKPATLEMIVQKATELGVTHLIPLDTARCQVHELRKTERLQLIIKEAAEQSERLFLPVLEPLLTWREFYSHPPKGLILAGDPWDYDERLSAFPTREGDLHLVIGPEGGLSLEELHDVRTLGAKVFLLGDTVLRMETAVIAALSVVQFG